MSKIYEVKISCSNCPCIQRRNKKRYCVADGFIKEIDVTITEFPSWCPLPDASEQAHSPNIESQVVCILCKGKNDDRAHYCQWCGDFLRW